MVFTPRRAGGGGVGAAGTPDCDHLWYSTALRVWAAGRSGAGTADSRLPFPGWLCLWHQPGVGTGALRRPAVGNAPPQPRAAAPGAALAPCGRGALWPLGRAAGHERDSRAPGSVEGPAGGRGGPSAGEEVGVSGPGRVSEVGAARGGSRRRCPRRGGTSRIRKKEGPVAGETSAGTGADVAQEARSSPRPLLALATRREAAAGGLRAGSEAGQRLPVPVQVPVPASAPGSGRFGPLSLKSLSVSVSSSLSHPTSCCYPPPPLTASVSTSVSSSVSGRLSISISISCSLPPSIYSFPCLTLAASLSLWLTISTPISKSVSNSLVLCVSLISLCLCPFTAFCPEPFPRRVGLSPHCQ